MSSKVAIQKITNANIYVDGASLLGRAEEVTLPEVTVKNIEHKALGLVGTVECFAGFEKLTAKIKWASFYAGVLAKAANPFVPVQVQVRASMQILEGGGVAREAAVVAMMTGTFRKLPLGSFKQHENVDAESELACTYAKLTVDGRDIVEFDALANIYKADGVDLLADYKANTGA